MIRIAIAAESPVIRAGLQAMLFPHFQILSAVSDLASLAALMDDEHPQAVVIAVDLPDPDPPPELLELASTPIVVLHEDPKPAWISEALRAGIRAVLRSDASPEELRAAVEAASAGLVVLHLQDTQPLLASLPPDPPRTTGPLTSREIEVLRMLSQGLSNKLIAAQLDISEHTVKFHVAALMSKLGAGSRTEAVTLGLRQGLIWL